MPGKKPITRLVKRELHHESGRIKEGIRQASAGADAVTPALIEEIAREGRLPPGVTTPAWRPVRAVAARVHAGMQPDPWCSSQTFTEVADVLGYRRKNGAGERLEADLGMSKDRLRQIVRGQDPTRVEALALAHRMIGLPMPCSPEDFGRWVAPRFGRTKYLAAVLDVIPQRLVEWCAGARMVDGDLRPRPASPALIRASDWVWRMGPFSPFIAPIDAPLYPGHNPEDCK